MIVLGVTGEPAAGKSALTSVLKYSFGVPVFDADLCVYKLLKTDFIIKSIKAFDPSLRFYDRQALRQWVKKDPRHILFLENLMHPLVRKEARSFLRRAHAYRCPFVCLSIPLLFEVEGYRDLCDLTILLKVTPQIQDYRLKKRGYDQKDIKWRLDRMLDASLKEALADFIIPSHLGFRYAFEQLKKIMEQLHHASNRS